MNAVEVHNLSKNYPLSKSQLSRLRHVFAPGKFVPGKAGPKDGLWALRDVSFSVARGEAFGIIGANGSGKSTLLQIVAGILRPTSGSVTVNGRLSALLELGSGFSPEFTGHDNVYLNGSLLGLSREEIDARYSEIEHFAGIGAFIDQPIKTYSTGMVLRLAFAVVAHVDPEVLIVDEALAVGDISFRQRCMRKIHDLRAHGTTILFVSHEASDVKALCERCLWLQNGEVQELGDADDVVAKYLSATLHREIQHQEVVRQVDLAEAETLANGDEPAAALVMGFRKKVTGHRYGDGRAAFIGAELIDSAGAPIDKLTSLERFVLRMSFRVNAPIASPIAGFLVRNGRGENIFGSNTARENYPMPEMDAGETHNVDFHWSTPDLARGNYRISIAISEGTMEDFQVCDYMEDVIELEAGSVNGSGETAAHGYFQLRCAAITVHPGQ